MGRLVFILGFTEKSMWAGPTLIILSAPSGPRGVPIGIITAVIALLKNRKGCRVVGVPDLPYIV